MTKILTALRRRPAMYTNPWDAAAAMRAAGRSGRPTEIELPAGPDGWRPCRWVAA